jgi:hypothetical protein
MMSPTSQADQDPAAEDLAALLLHLEVELMQPEIRRDRDRAGDLLAQGFREFGSSGREWSRETILDLLAEEPHYTPPAIEGFAITMLSPGSVLVTYRAVRPHITTLRSSIWVLSDERWRVLFHQGTICAQA